MEPKDARDDEPHDDSSLNANHVRVLSASFGVLDQQLADVVAAMGAAPSPLSSHAVDLSPEQRAIVLDHVEQIRDRLAGAVSTLGLRTPTRVPITRTLRAVLMHAQVALEDLAPAKLRGYGLLGAEPGQRIATVLSDLDRTISRLAAYVARPERNDLASRIGKLDTEAVRLDVLAQIERVVTRHGFVELRPAIAALVELLEAGTFEVALFGRVSCGKSSLVNAVIGANVLPVGATPVTSIPTRVRWAPQLTVEVRYLDGRRERVDASRLAELVTEAGSAENHLGVASAAIWAPAVMLGARVALVDTPGVGSLAAHGAREAYTYLPRCDLGVLMIEAVSTVTREDVDLLRRFAESGIESQVVLAKVDLVPRGDRERVRAYFAAELERAVGRSVPVDLVSTMPDEVSLAKRWFDERIAPLNARGARLLAESAARKLAALHASTVAILRVAAERADGSSATAVQEIETLALAAESTLHELAAHASTLISRSEGAAGAAMRAAAHAIAKTKNSESRRVLVECLAAEADAIRHALELDLVSARAKLRDTIAAIARFVPSTDCDLHLDLVSQPVLELPPSVLVAQLDAPYWPAVERRLASRIEASLGPSIRDAFHDLERRLREWSNTVVANLGEQVASRVEPARAYARAVGSPPIADVTADLETLERL
ncbi:MAG TPA: dynamin family protein [Kofleriaceae bacterium]